MSNSQLSTANRTTAPKERRKTISGLRRRIRDREALAWSRVPDRIRCLPGQSGRKSGKPTDPPPAPPIHPPMGVGWHIGDDGEIHERLADWHADAMGMVADDAAG